MHNGICITQVPYRARGKHVGNYDRTWPYRPERISNELPIHMYVRTFVAINVYTYACKQLRGRFVCVSYRSLPITIERASIVVIVRPQLLFVFSRYY